MSYYRLLKNTLVSKENIIGGLQRNCEESIEKGRHYLCIQDTSAISYGRKKGRIQEGTLGWIGNESKDSGFYLHPCLVVDAQKGVSVGFSHVHVWSRDKAALNRRERAYKSQPIEQKESWRWIESIAKSRQVLAKAGQVTFIQDREGDIYELFAQAEEGTAFIVRSRDNRKMKGEKLKLFDFLNQQVVRGHYTLKVGGDARRNRTGRSVQIALRWATVELAVPNRLKGSGASPQRLRAILAQEVPASVPAGETPIQWYLLTNHSVEHAQHAQQIVEWYAQRWHIETLFRILKKEGLDVENNELEDGRALVRMCLFSLAAALQIMQTWLVYKQSDDELPLTHTFSPAQIQCLVLLNHKLEGKTKKQQNPFAKKSLRWAAWVLARLGGWSGLQSQRPPGVVTFIHGFRRFELIYQGFLFNDMYKP
jgi:Transposase DDE domain